MRAVAAVVLDKLLIDFLAPAKAFLHAVPEADAVLAELPAQAHFAAVIAGQEIDQADVQVLDQHAHLFQALEGLLERGGAGIAACSKGEKRPGTDTGAAGHADALRGAIELFLGGLILGFLKERVAQKALHLREHPFGLGQREISRHFYSAGRSFHSCSMAGRKREYK